MQRLFNQREQTKIEIACNVLNEVIVSLWGNERPLELADAMTFLGNSYQHRTSDGKPYVEPEPPIPEGYRKANADEWKRTDVMVWSYSAGQWEKRLIQGSKFDPPGGRSIYIVPIDPPLTDEDACVWPRLLVMVRDNEGQPWFGPYPYQGKDDAGHFQFAVSSGKHSDRLWKQARRATPEEIEAAK